MRKTYLLIITAATTAILIAGSATAESLWTVADKSNSVYTDKRAAKVGDVLTVIIVESATSTSSASTDTKKNSSTDISSGLGPLVKNIPAISTSGGDSMKASGSTSRNMSFSTRMTVRVTRVDNCGNLEIEGTRMVQTNKEKEEIKLTGTIRPEDIATDNTVLSTSIADAKIAHQGSGPIGSAQKMGIITRLLRILF